MDYTHLRLVGGSLPHIASATSLRHHRHAASLDILTKLTIQGSRLSWIQSRETSGAYKHEEVGLRTRHLGILIHASYAQSALSFAI